MIQNINIKKKMVITTKMTMTKKIFLNFLFIDILIVLFCILSDNYIYLLNTQIAFSSSLLISLATFYSYKKNVLKSVDTNIKNQNEDIDFIDKIDDPYDLYSQDINEKIIENPTKEQIQEAIKPVKQNHFANLKSSIFSFTSFYRIGSYVLLIIGFFYLNNNNLLDIYSYLFGFMILPIVSLFSK